MIGVDVLAGILFLMVAALAIALPIGILWLVVKLLVGIGWLLARVFGFLFRVVARGSGRLFTFLRGEVTDVLSTVGSVLAAAVFAPLVVGNIALGRWSRVGHYGRALEDEIVSLGCSLYRIALGHPIRLLGLSRLTDGIERRLPEALASSPGRERRDSKGRPAFPGYRVVSALPRGGSGAHLYLAEPLPEQHDRLAAEGKVCPGRVVLKSFSLEEGSSLPQIVRESRALTSAKELGLVVDHVLEAERFWYAMPYVPGDDLAHVTRRLHDRSGSEGLGDPELREVVGYVADVVASLERFHSAGLWHKDIKPSNVIVSGDGRAYLVDLGLVTPLRSALTLTTHGTEYFRDPEMVRLAMQGVKVHEVDGVKFDLYSAGAVLYSLIENSFPAHGSLSRMTKRAPEAVRWIVRRAMADLGHRYGASREMLADLRAVAESADPYGLKVADLPSVRGDEEALAGAGAEAGARTAVFGVVAAGDPWPKRWPWTGAATRVSTLARSATDGAKEAARTAAARARHRARIGFGAVAALALFALMGGSALVLFLAPGRAPWSHDGTVAAFPGVSFHAEPAAASWEGRLRNVFASAGEPWRALLGCDDDRRGCRNPSHRCDLHPGAIGGDFDVLVLNDLPAGAEEELATALQGLLEEEGCTVWGLRPAASAQAREIELIAAARRAAGLGGPGDADAAGRLSDLVEEDAELDAVLWLGPGGERGTSVYRLVTGGESASARQPVAVRF